MTSEVLDTETDVMLSEEGSDHSFHCTCGCNVFKRVPAEQGYKSFKCNGCSTVWTGVPVDSEGQ